MKVLDPVNLSRLRLCRERVSDAAKRGAAESTSRGTVS